MKPTSWHVAGRASLTLVEGAALHLDQHPACLNSAFDTNGSVRTVAARPGTLKILFAVSRHVQCPGSVRSMAARRSLGGGRVLGSGKNLAPPVPVKPQLRPSGALSPSSSSISLNSQTSSTPISTENEDITARVALDEHGTAQAAAAASSRMVCPICNDEMVCKVRSPYAIHNANILRRHSSNLIGRYAPCWSATSLSDRP